MGGRKLNKIKYTLNNYCFHCSKPIEKTNNDKYVSHIHRECRLERDKIKRALSGERWKQLMKDPKIINKINKIDEETIKNIEHKNFYKKETKNNLFLQHEDKRITKNAFKSRQQRRAGKKMKGDL